MNFLRQKGRENNDHYFLSFLDRLESHQLDPYTEITDAHYFMAQVFKDNPVVYMMEKELSLALLNSKSSVKIEDVKIKSESFVLYLNLDYGDMGHPCDTHNHRCVFCTVKNVESYVHITICSISEKQTDRDSKYLRNLENSTFSTVSIKKGETFDKSFFDIRRKETIDNYEYVGTDGDRNTQDGRESDYDIKAKIFHLIVSMYVYLSYDEDLVIEAPPISQKDVEKIKNPKKRRKAEKKLSEQSPYSISYIGRKYANKLQTSNSGTGIKREQKYSFKVQGFFNSYWYGKRRDANGNKIPGQYKKIKWIEPQIRNKHLPESPVKEKIYKVK